MTTRIAARPAAPPALSGEPLRVAVLGATGYVGAELVRILERHPHVRIVGLAARNRDGMPVGEAFAHLAGTGHRLEAALPAPSPADAVFLAPPHGQAATIAPPLLERGVLVVDLGPDFRLSDPADYPTWYGFEHPAPELLPGGPGRSGDTAMAAAVYGLPELHREALTRTRPIASPRCPPPAPPPPPPPRRAERADRRPGRHRQPGEGRRGTGRPGLQRRRRAARDGRPRPASALPVRPTPDLSPVEERPVLPSGFVAGGMSAGIKASGRSDLGIGAGTTAGPAPAPAPFPPNPRQAAPGRPSREPPAAAG